MSNTNLTIFNNDKFGDMRAYLDDSGEPWFCGNDVAKALGYSNTRDAISKHCKNKGVAKRDVGVVTGKKLDGTDAIQNISMIYINESNLYRLVFGSKLESAEQFQDWVTEEVLPTLRKTGSYSIQTTPIDTIVFSSDPLERCKALTLVLEEERAKKEKAITERAMMQEAFSRAIVSDKDVGYTDFITRLKMTIQCACSLLKELNIFGKKGPLADFGEWFKTEPNKDGFPARFVTPLGQEKLIGLFNNNRDKMIAVNGTYRYLQPKNRVKQITLLSQS
nr:MAG TPA: repressor domain protein [Caudoviricetes sp.]